MAESLARPKSVTGLTVKERLKQLQGLEGCKVFSSNLDGAKPPVQGCQGCELRLRKLEELEKEFEVLRKDLLSGRRRLEVAEKTEKEKKRGQEESALIRESAKLRITIDMLMRFRVCETI